MKKIYKLENLDCANCAAKMQDAISKIEGITNCSVNFITQRMIIETEEEISEELAKKIIKLCRKIEPDCKIFF